jgi:thiol-disulfide isomerase/thioredoxin
MTVNGGDAPTKAGTVPTVFLPANALETALKTIDGKPFKLGELKGKVLLIDLWATWCGPCRSEVPELVQMQTEYGPRGFEVVGLDISPESDTPEGVRDFMKEFKINYKVAFVEREMAGSLMRGGNIPQSLVVAPDGRVIIHFTGFDRLSTPKRMRTAIEQALQANEKPSSPGEAAK